MVDGSRDLKPVPPLARLGGDMKQTKTGFLLDLFAVLETRRLAFYSSIFTAPLLLSGTPLSRSSSPSYLILAWTPCVRSAALGFRGLDHRHCLSLPQRAACLFFFQRRHLQTLTRPPSRNAQSDAAIQIINNRHICNPSARIYKQQSHEPVAMEREVDMPDPPQRSWTARVRKHLPPLTFISIHYAYFIVFAMIGSVIFWKSSSDQRPVSYVDSLFLIVSAMTLAGLNTVNLSELTTWQQFLLFFYIMLGSTIWVSIWTVLARKQVFSRRFDDIARAQRAKMSASVLSFRRTLSFRKAVTEPIQHTSSVLPGPVIKRHASDYPDVDENTLTNARLRRDSVPEPNHTLNHEPKPTSQDKADEKENHIAFQDTPHPRQQQEKTAAGEAGDENTSNAYNEDDRGQTMRYFLKHRASGRHGEFHSLTSEERTQLGGCEYSALRILAVVVPLYFAMWQILGCVALGAWINNNMPDTARQNGINPWWLGIFNGVSAFNNSGMSLLDANMVPFQGAYFVLITMGLMILAGNTAYPIFLRFIFWSFLRILRLTTRPAALSHFKLTLEFILKYPRRVYTNLFPSRATWWLLFMLIGLNCVDWVAFEIFNIGNPVIESIPTGPRVLDGLFQALGKLLRVIVSRQSLKLILRSCPLWWLLCCPHCSDFHRHSISLCCHDVHIRIPRRHYYATLQRLRRALSWHIPRRH